MLSILVYLKVPFIHRRRNVSQNGPCKAVSSTYVTATFEHIGYSTVAVEVREKEV